MIKSMGKNKMTVSQLFQVYAKVFPDQRNFWLQLAKEEEKEVANAVPVSSNMRQKREGERRRRFKHDV